MISVQPKPDLPVTPIRGPHFFKHSDTHFRETDQGESVMSLPLQTWLDAMLAAKDDPVTLEALHDIGANAGLAMNLTKLGAEKEPKTVQNLLVRAADHCLRHDALGQEFIELPLDRVASLIIIHHREGDFKRKQAVLNFIQELGLEPNEARIFADFCPDCGRKKNVSH